MRRLSGAALGAACCFLSATALAQDASPEAAGPKAEAPDKSGYHLFNRTPSDQMRPLSTDRPDQTEGPFTVDAGHLQLESDFLTYTYDRVHAPGDKLRNMTYAAGTINLRLGLLDFVDCHVLFAPWIYQETKDLGTRDVDHVQGWGDLTFRVKINLWGNEGGRTALALLPYVSFPVARDGLGQNAYEGGLLVPFNIILFGGFSLGVHVQLGAQRDRVGSGTHLFVTLPLSLSYEIVEGLSAYLEFYNEQTSEKHVPWIGMVDVGVCWIVTENIQVDAGVHTGVTRSAPDVNAFTGITIRY